MLFVHTLGIARIDVGDLEVNPGSVRKFAFMLYMWSERGRRVPRELLKELVFPDQSDRNSKHSLRELLYQFRNHGARFESDNDGIQLIADGVGSDYGELIDDRRLTPARLDALERGFLPGYEPDHSEAFAVWLQSYRLSATFEITNLLRSELHRARAVADWASTARIARAWLGIEPLHEEATFATAESLAMTGSKTRALAVLDRYVEEVGPTSASLKVPAEMLRRRIRDRLPDGFQSQGRSPFVGRDREMIALRERFREMQTGVSQCVVIGGEAGIGKTRLAHEFLSVAALDGSRVERCVSQAHDTHRPMGAFVDIVPALVKLPGSIGASPESLATLTRLTTHDPSIERPFPSSLEIEAMSFATSKAIADLVDALATESPLVLSFDDTHWMDRLSAQTIGALVSVTNPQRLMVVITTRDPRQFMAEVRHASNISVIGLRGLAPESSSRLVRHAIGEIGPHDEDWSDRIVDKAGGNPLYALALAAESRLAGSTFTIPATLRELLSRRLDAVSPKALALLQTCISLGRHATIDRLTRALGVQHIDMLTSVSELASAALIDSSDTEIHSSHPLLADALRDEAEPAWVSLINRRVAEVLQADADADQAPALWWDAAERWADAGSNAAALRAFRTCARHAIEIGRPAEAASILDRALLLEVESKLIAETARELILAGDLAGESSLVVKASERLHALDDVEGNSSEHDELELAELRGFLHGLIGDEADNAARILQCTQATDATPAHRIGAAICLLWYSEKIGLAEMLSGNEWRASKGDLAAVDPEVRAEYELLSRVFATDATEIEEAATAARSLAISAESIAPPKRIKLLRISSFALWTAGCVREAVAIGNYNFELAKTIGNLRTSVQIAAETAGMLLDIGDLDAANHWIGRAEQGCMKNPAFSDDFSLVANRLDLALTLGNTTKARAIFDVASRAGVFERSAARERWGRAALLRLRAIEGKGLRQEDLKNARLLASSGNPDRAGIRDFEVSAACQMLQKCGQREEATECLRTFIDAEASRRRPFSLALQRLSAELGVRLSDCADCGTPFTTQADAVYVSESESRRSRRWPRQKQKRD